MTTKYKYPHISFRLSESEKAIIRKAAKAQGTTLSEYLRRQVLGDNYYKKP